MAASTRTADFTGIIPKLVMSIRWHSKFYKKDPYTKAQAQKYRKTWNIDFLKKWVTEIFEPAWSKKNSTIKDM